MIYGYCETLNAYDTYQFSDYSKYDNTFFEDKKSYLNPIKNVILTLNNSVKRVKPSNKKNFLIYLSMFILGIILCVATISMMTAYTLDESSFCYLSNYYTFEHSGPLSEKEKIKEDLIDFNEKGIVSSLNAWTKENIRYEKRFSINYDYSFTQDVKTYLFYEDLPLMYGSAPNNSQEIIVSKNIAERIMSAVPSLDYIDIINEELLLGKTTKKICGITEMAQNACFSKELCSIEIALNNPLDQRYSEFEVMNGEKLYSIVSGRDVDSASSEREVLVSNNDARYSIGEEVTLRGQTYTCVGKYNYRFFNDNMFITNKPYQRNEGSVVGSVCYHGIDDDYIVVDGRQVQKYDEVIVDAYSSNNIGDNIVCNVIIGKELKQVSFKVVGKYLGSSNIVLKNNMVSAEGFILNTHSFDSIVFGGINKNKLNEVIHDTNLSYDYEYNRLKDAAMKENRDEIIAYSFVAIALFLIGIIFSVLTLRSKMLSDIYRIGVFRSIGAKKKLLIKEYLVDSTLISMFTTFLGYLFTSFCYMGVFQAIVRYFGMAINIINIPLLLSIGLMMALFNILLSIVPIVLLLRKTPAEIMNKYDI